ncbi:MAG: hypothetical protein JW959_12325 [Pirellulales bacterium]|nr:hypothetical protein [Pirellulales bacterium]
MDPFRVFLALGPVAMYMLLLGAINLSRRPLLVSGSRDAAALAVAVSGLIVVGPLKLLFPFETAVVYGSYFWLLLLALYVLCVLLWLLMLRPRLVVYNVTADKLRPILAEAVDRLGAEVRWAGNSLSLPALGVQLYIDGFAPLRCVSLVSAGGSQNHAGWRRLEAALESVLARTQLVRNPRGFGLIGLGLLLVLIVVLVVAQNPESVVQSLADVAQGLLRMVGLPLEQ